MWECKDCYKEFEGFIGMDMRRPICPACTAKHSSGYTQTANTGEHRGEDYYHDIGSNVLANADHDHSSQFID